MKKETKDDVFQTVSVIRESFVILKTNLVNTYNEKEKPISEVIEEHMEDMQEEDSSTSRHVAPSVDPAKKKLELVTSN
ncbi:hypothetical protein L9F63_005035 [Diploptera punctata]|uniref:Uncharacterized protein n=1 Tax=Diploptera punctata TaxID=6984 RepID=A0AAD7ZE84_DIPPU|nr:hypothetical protein L9F63_005035 [Diploptera punctata]